MKQILQPIEDIGKLAKKTWDNIACRRGPVIGKSHFTLRNSAVDMPRWSAQILRPKGIGALYIRMRHENITLDVWAGMEMGYVPARENTGHWQVCQGM